ncbi:MAG: Gfo/Idh/MocA family oxidoreductase [Opitutaceae bacterium]|nr:Gfo/Idh/MocA family oxidoreductase [Opitutaceae bacterium]
MSSSEKIRVGVIGAGTNTKLKHIPGLLAIDGVSVDVVCNRSEESSQKAADAFGIPRIASEWKAVVADESIDAICIGTWPYLHAEISIAALRAGKHVLTEARMAMNAVEGQAMIDASRERPELVAQIVPAPFTLKWDATIKAVLDSGDLGDLREIRSIKTLPMNVDSSAPLSWRQNIEYSGNNAMMLGIYYEVVQRWIQRQPSRVWAYGRVFSENRFDPETSTDQTVRIPESLTYTAVYDDGLHLTGLMTGIELGNGRDEYAISGSKGTLRLDLQTGTLYQTLIGETETILEPKPESIGSWNVEADFIDSIRSGSPVTLTSFADGLAYMKFTDAVKASFDADGAWQSI